MDVLVRCAETVESVVQKSECSSFFSRLAILFPKVVVEKVAIRRHILLYGKSTFFVCLEMITVVSKSGWRAWKGHGGMGLMDLDRELSRADGERKCVVRRHSCFWHKWKC